MIFDSGQSYAGHAHNDAMAAAHAHAVPIVVARRGMRWTSGDGVTLDILAPSTPFLADTGDDVNENSIVTRLSYNDGSRIFRELFMGDAGEASEARLLASGADLHANVLKVGHHGSRYASTPAFICRSSSANRHILRRPPQYVRASCTNDARNANGLRSKRVSNRSLRRC
jgi:beta-lactamase superfamily II metal-dependent hydrolase